MIAGYCRQFGCHFQLDGDPAREDPTADQYHFLHQNSQIDSGMVALFLPVEEHQLAHETSGAVGVVRGVVEEWTQCIRCVGGGQVEIADATLSIMVKWWVTPAVSWPIASIFCDWRSRSSSRWRSSSASCL